MVEIGYGLSSEEHGPKELVRQAQLASDAGIGSVCISDHFHPWIDEQGQSPFVWSVIGAIAATTPLAVMTAVTCPTTRIHPAIVAQAAATCAVLLDDRFELGVGTGENLNEHVLGDPWPPTEQRLEMLVEAVGVIRALWNGDEVTHHGTYFTVENARIYSRPERPPNVLVSVFGSKATDAAAEIADGFVSTRPDAELLERYRARGGRGVASGAVKLCWGPDAAECRREAYRLWPTSGLPGELSQELRTPALFEQAASLIDEELVTARMPCGPDIEPIVDAVRSYAEAGFDRVYLTQIGGHHDEFLRFYQHELAAALAELGAAADADASMAEPARADLMRRSV